jgi:1-acyl-sn-glycerol-3-phosphate acyltransferase
VFGTPARWVRRLARFWARGILFLLVLLADITHSVTRSAPDRTGPVLIVANHQSAWETIAALVLFPDVAIVAKRELASIPVMGWYLRHSPMIVIDRAGSSTTLRQMVSACRSEVENGRSILIFPEGTRKPPGSPIIFQRGVELLYRSLDVPVVTYAHNSGLYWRTDGLVSGTVSASIRPLADAGGDARDVLRAAESRLDTEVRAMIASDRGLARV